jgi:hypothetical protein
MTKPFGETYDSPETDSQAVARLLEAKLAPFEWQEWGGRRLSWLGSGKIREGKFVPIGGAYDSPIVSESRVIRYRRNQPLATEEHTISVDWEVGQDSEGRTCVLRTHYQIDLLSGELNVTQSLGVPLSRERAASYPHFGIQDTQPAEQWHQLRGLLETWE